jgi:hypothetical protein
MTRLVEDDELDEHGPRRRRWLDAKREAERSATRPVVEGDGQILRREHALVAIRGTERDRHLPAVGLRRRTWSLCTGHRSGAHRPRFPMRKPTLSPRHALAPVDPSDRRKALSSTAAQEIGHATQKQIAGPHRRRPAKCKVLMGNHTRGRFGGRHPVCGTGVTSRISVSTGRPRFRSDRSSSTGLRALVQPTATFRQR